MLLLVAVLLGALGEGPLGLGPLVLLMLGAALLAPAASLLNPLTSSTLNAIKRGPSGH